MHETTLIPDTWLCCWTCLERGWRATGWANMRGNKACLFAVPFWNRAGAGMGEQVESGLCIRCIRLISRCCTKTVPDIFGKLWCMFQVDVLVGCERIFCHCCIHSFEEQPSQATVPRHPIPQHLGGLSSSWTCGFLANPTHLPEVWKSLSRSCVSYPGGATNADTKTSKIIWQKPDLLQLSFYFEARASCTSSICAEW